MFNGTCNIFFHHHNHHWVLINFRQLPYNGSLTKSASCKTYINELLNDHLNTDLYELLKKRPSGSRLAMGAETSPNSSWGFCFTMGFHVLQICHLTYLTYKWSKIKTCHLCMKQEIYINGSTWRPSCDLQSLCITNPLGTNNCLAIQYWKHSTSLHAFGLLIYFLPIAALFFYPLVHCYETHHYEYQLFRLFKATWILHLKTNWDPSTVTLVVPSRPFLAQSHQPENVFGGSEPTAEMTIQSGFLVKFSRWPTLVRLETCDKRGPNLDWIDLEP